LAANVANGDGILIAWSAGDVPGITGSDSVRITPKALTNFSPGLER